MTSAASALVVTSRPSSASAAMNNAPARLESLRMGLVAGESIAGMMLMRNEILKRALRLQNGGLPHERSCIC